MGRVTETSGDLRETWKRRKHKWHPLHYTLHWEGSPDARATRTTQLQSLAIELNPEGSTEFAAQPTAAPQEHQGTHLDVVVNMYEATALQNRLGQCRDEDLLLPFCMFPGFHS